MNKNKIVLRNLERKLRNKKINENFILGSIAALSSGVSLVYNILKIMENQRGEIYYTNTLREQSTLSEHLTKKLYELTKDDRYEVRYLNLRGNRAFTYPLGRTIFLTGDLIKFLKTERQVIAIVLHEYGHKDHSHPVDKFDLVSNLFISNVLVGAGFIIAKYIKKNIQTSLITLLLAILFFFYSRYKKTTYRNFLRKTHEWEADSMAVKCGYGKDLIEALNLLWTNNIIKACKYSKMTESQCLKSLESPVHGGFEERIEKIYTNVVKNSQVKPKDIKKLFEELKRDRMNTDMYIYK